jgi:hypothetical protein
VSLARDTTPLRRYRRRIPGPCLRLPLPMLLEWFLVTSDEILFCEHCDQPIERALLEVMVAVWHRESSGFFLPEPPPLVGVPLRSRQQLCEACSAKVLAAVDGPWAVYEDDAEGAVAAPAATGA